VSDEEERQQFALGAVADLIQQIDPGSMVTRFVLVVEVVDAENQRGCWLLTPPDSRPWDTLGLCSFAAAVEQNAANNN